jgi:bifunctional DNA-binding transcriptional regulator/antitoxin component of YhaV-PrlF toxin-antitoxin module
VFSSFVVVVVCLLCADKLFQVAFLWQSLIGAYYESLFGAGSRGKACCVWVFGGVNVPLTELVKFKAVLQKGNRIQLPKVVRWRFKLESDQVLKVTLTAMNSFGAWETFYARMDRSGRITVPKLTLRLLQSRAYEEQGLTGAVMEVRLEPV